MSKILELRNCVRDYAWGSSSLLTELLGTPNPSGGPQAELWMGAHPAAASQVEGDHGWISLSQWIAEDPAGRLGARTVEQHGDELPFLFKVLAANEPLSLQAHPDARQARHGFARENEAGLPADSLLRSYRDPRPKPELLCALTPFDALLGFRPPQEICTRLGALELRECEEAIQALSRGGSDALRVFFAWLVSQDEKTQSRLARKAAKRCLALPEDEARGWVVELSKKYPDDIGILAPLFLNVVRLAPGQAVYLPAGELHSYLSGCGVEIMANSDNVLRGGLTHKHVDVSELVDVLTFATGPVSVVEPVDVGPGVRRYETSASEFELSHVDVTDVHTRVVNDSVEILLCTSGEGRVFVGEEGEDGNELTFSRGTSLFVSADTGAYRVEGACSFFRATLPER
ncbi:MAG: mannose-6-phosphate isomerase [Myxococcota bacterium]